MDIPRSSQSRLYYLVAAIFACAAVGFAIARSLPLFAAFVTFSVTFFAIGANQHG